MINSSHCLVSCNFIVLKSAINYFVVSLFDLIFVDCIVFDKETTHYSTNKFHDIYCIQRRLWWFFICRLQYVEYSGLGGCCDQSFFDRFFNVFFQSKLFFIIRSKNYILHTGKDINHTNDVDVNNALCCPTPAALSAQNIPTVVEATVVMNSPSPIVLLVVVASTVDPSSIGFLMFF